MVQRCLPILLYLAFCVTNTLTVSAFTTPIGASRSVRIYLNPNTGRFWTMDTFQGNNEDPLSLHKYLYCHDNPINGIDPSGHELVGMIDIMSSFGGFFAQISPVASSLSFLAGQVPDPSWDWKSITVDTVVLYGADDKTDRDFTRANTIYAQARIHVNRGTSKTLSENDTKKLVGDDLLVDAYQQPGKPTPEEVAVTQGQCPDRITAYYVKGLSGGGEGIGYGEAFTKDFASPPHPSVFVANKANYVVMSHELGHILLEDSGMPVHMDATYYPFNLMVEGSHNSQMGELMLWQCLEMRKYVSKQ